MNAPRCQSDDYIQFLLATPKTCSATEAARVQPHRPQAPAHDAITRLLHRLEPDPETLWREALPQLRRGDGVLVLDDSTLDKPYAQQIDLVTRHWSGKHHAVVRGINLMTLVWTDGDRIVPCDYRVYDKERDGKTKNDHFRDLLAQAKARNFQPKCVLFDTWYASLDNLKRVRSYGWHFVTRLKANRRVDPDRTGNRPLSSIEVSAQGTILHLEGYGMVKVFKIVAPNGDIEYWATSDLEMEEGMRLSYAEQSWAIEQYHRGLKQFCGVEKAMVRSARAQRNHIALAIRAFLRLEYYCFIQGMSWVEAKTRIFREAVRHYLTRPLYVFAATA